MNLENKNLRQPHSSWDMHVRLEMLQLLVDSKNEWKWILFLFQCEENRPNCHRDSSCDVCVPPSVYGQQ